MRRTSRGAMTRVLTAVLVAAMLGACGDDDTESEIDNAGTDAASDAANTSRDASLGIDAAANTDAGVRLDASLDAGAPDTGSGGPIEAGVLPDGGVALSDSQIVGVASVINMGEIQLGQYAATRAQSAAARDFAQMMVTMHMAAQARQSALGLPAAESPIAAMVQTSAASARARLEAQPDGARFDYEYMDSQVSLHESALSLIDQLLPQADAPALQSELMTTRTEVVQHLQQARAIRDALASDGGIASGADAGGDAG